MERAPLAYMCMREYFQGGFESLTVKNTTAIYDFPPSFTDFCNLWWLTSDGMNAP